MVRVCQRVVARRAFRLAVVGSFGLSLIASSGRGLPAADGPEDGPAAAAAVADGDPVPLVPFGAGLWRYLDSGADPGKGWLELDFDDSAWQEGRAILGYGDEDVATTIDWGANQDEKHAVSWFRRRFRLESLDEVAGLAGRLVCDDGAAVYINGQEVCRENLPAGDLTAETRASAALATAVEREQKPFLVEREMLVAGKNIIAVRLHQANGESSDLAFDLELRAVTDPDEHRRLAAALAEERAAAEARAARVQQEEQFGVLLPQQEEQLRVLLPQLRRRRSVMLQDGVVSTEWFDGVARRTQKMVYDAVAQAKGTYGVRFVRVYAGDTLEKIAAQTGTSLERLRLLNRKPPGYVYEGHDLACFHWTHTVSAGETLASIAGTYGTTAEVLRELNGIEAAAEAIAGTAMLVPGTFNFQPGRGEAVGRLELAAAVAAGRGPADRVIRLGGDGVIEADFLEAIEFAPQLIERGPVGDR